MFERRLQVGFTLVELLVIISVIALLSTIVVTNVRGAQYKARVAAAQASLNNAFLGAVLCLEDGKPLLGAGTGGDECDISGSFFFAPANQPICTGSVNMWPDITKYGFSTHVCASSVAENQFVVLTSDGINDIVCSYNYTSAAIKGGAACRVAQNGQLGLCTADSGPGSGKLCRISGGCPPAPSTCNQCDPGEYCQSLDLT